MVVICKGYVRVFINEGYDVCIVMDLKNVLLLYGGLEGVWVVLFNVVIEILDDFLSIIGIIKFNNF